MKKIIALLFLSTAIQAVHADLYDDKVEAIADKAQHCFALGDYMRNVVYRGMVDKEPRQKYIDTLNNDLDNGDKLGIGEENRDKIAPAVNFTYDHAYSEDDAGANAEVTLCVAKLDTSMK
ncbi:MAG: hypothetical protein ACYC4K_03580 [Thiobacillus sp.]